MRTTIAVVNADMGVEDAHGERHNYSAAIIGTLDADFVLVAAVVAESGFESGSFGAIIKFPSDVSERIISFNSHQPERVQLEFQVNRNLTEADYVDTYVKIMNLQVSINTTLAYTYVASIYRQFHAAQDHLDFVFLNALDSFASIDTIRLPAFSSTLDLDELPDIPLETEGVDTAQHTDMVAGFAEMVSSVYMSSYEAASQTYLLMREGMFGLIDELPVQEDDWMNKLAAWAEVKIYYSDNLQEFTAALEDYAQEIQDWLESVFEWLLETGEWFEDFVEDYEEAMGLFEEMDDYIEYIFDHLEDALETLQTIYNAMAPGVQALSTWRTGLANAESALQTWRNQLNNYINTVCLNCSFCNTSSTGPPPTAPSGATPPTQPNIFIPAPNDFQLPDADELIDKAPDWSLPDLPDATQIKVPQIYDAPEFTEAPPVRPTNLQPPRPDDFWGSINFMHNQLLEFDVDEFLGDDIHQMVLGFLSSFDDFLGFLSDDMDMQFDLNLLELDLVRFAYIEYLAGLKADTLQGEADEQERLRGDLDEIIDINESNHENTHGRLSDFAGMMPESRTYAGLNSDLVDFTVSPFEFVHPEVRQARLRLEMEQEHSDGIGFLDIIILCAAALLLLLTVVGFVVHYRKRKLEEEG